MTGDLAADAANWVALAIGSPVVEAERLLGGMSSDVHRVRLADGTTHVLRHITDRAWLAREPDLIRNEAAALDLLTGSAVVAPRHEASDAEEGLLLMTVVEGGWSIDCRGVEVRSEALAEVAATIASVELPGGSLLEPWRPWAAEDLRPPPWGDGRLWRAAIERWTDHGPPMTEQPVLLHRDLHPLNVLWDRESVGVVDWVNACVGHPHAELGHCRWNLTVLAGPEAADAFLERYLAVTASGPYDLWWDLTAAVSFLPGPIGVSGWHDAGRADLTPDTVIAATEAFVRSAVEQF